LFFLGRSIGCIVSVYQYFKDFIFKAHNVETCEMMRTTLTDRQLKAWFKWTEDQPLPKLLRIENRKLLIAWFLDRVFICKFFFPSKNIFYIFPFQFYSLTLFDLHFIVKGTGCGLTSHRMAHQQGRSVLMLEYEQEEIRSNLMAKRIQGMYRSKKARDWIKKLLLKIVKKHWDANAQMFYYVNERTGVISWEKPKQLGDGMKSFTILLSTFSKIFLPSFFTYSSFFTLLFQILTLKIHLMYGKN
jgi:hypothetical protein